jgi:hypothetical protein
MEGIIEKYKRDNQGITKVIINQFCGLGDILFIEPIYRYIDSLGLKVIAPVQDQNIWIQDHIPYVEFKKMSEFDIDYEKFTFEIINGDSLYVPLRFSDQIHRSLPPHDCSASRYWMTDKYRVLGLDPKKWEDLSFTRNIAKEEDLKKRIVGDNKDYIFLNTFYQNSLNAEMEIKINSGLPVVKMEKVDGFSMIDWCKIIEDANQVHTVSTSTLYLIHSIHQEGKEYHLYPRGVGANHYTVEEFLPNYWIKH